MNFFRPFITPTNRFMTWLATPMARKVADILIAQEPQKTTQADPMYAVAGIGRQYQAVQKQLDYIQVLYECFEMYANDGDIGAGINGIGIDGAQKDNEGYPFRLSDRRILDGATTTDKTTGRRKTSPAQQRIDDVYDRLEERLFEANLYGEMAYQLSRTALQGRFALEAIWDLDSGDLLRVEPIPGIEDHAVLRKLFHPDTKAHVGWGLFDTRTEERIAEFEPWRILPFTWNNRMPILTSARATWRQLHENEEDAYVARKTRANSRLGFTNEKWTREECLRFMQDFDAAKRNGTLGPDSDVAFNGAITLLDAMNAQLGNFTDLEYKRRIVHSAAMKPFSALAGYGAQAINRDTLREQMKGYYRFLGELRIMAARPIMTLGKLQLALWGHDPADYPFRLMWTENDDRDFTEYVRALVLLASNHEAGLSWTTVLQEAGFDPEQERDNREYDAELSGADRIDTELAAVLGKLTSGERPPGRNGNGNRVGAVA